MWLKLGWQLPLVAWSSANEQDAAYKSGNLQACSNAGRELKKGIKEAKHKYNEAKHKYKQWIKSH